jgi:hypothetical protein
MYGGRSDAHRDSFENCHNSSSLILLYPSISSITHLSLMRQSHKLEGKYIYYLGNGNKNWKQNEF